MSEVKCTTLIPDVSDLKPQELTVGRHFFLSCQGQWDKSFDFTKAQFLADEKSKYLFKLFKAEARSTDTFEIDMTLYASGQVQFPDMIISDGTLQLSLGPQQFTVASVLPPPDPQKPEPPQPFGFAVGSLHWPISYTLIFAALILAIIIQAIMLAARAQRWKRLREVVKSFESVQTPENQFYKTVRALEKKDYPMDDIDRAAKVYILRRFQVPIFDLPLKETVSFIKKNYPQLKEQRRQIYNIIKDLDILKKENQLTTDQKLKFVSRFYEFIANCEKTRGHV